MENVDIYELNDIFYKIIDDIDELNKIILMRLYKVVNDSLIIYKESKYNGSFVDFLKKSQEIAYSNKRKKLSDRQIVDYEYKRVVKEYNKQNTKRRKEIINGNDNVDDNKNSLLTLVEHYLKIINLFYEADTLDQASLDYMKQQIANIEILLDLKNGFYYENYLLFVSELERIKNVNEVNILKRK